MNIPWYRRWFSSRPAADLTEARLKAEGGDRDAQFALGMNCDFRTRDASGEVEAVSWYRRAADQGHALAQFNLAVMYATGQGVPLDDVEAAQWYRRSADLGDPGAQFQMGKRCQRSSFDTPKPGGSEARIEAYKWFNLSAAEGYKDSDSYLERIVLLLTREEFDEGQRRVATFLARAKHPIS